MKRTLMLLGILAITAGSLAYAQTPDMQEVSNTKTEVQNTVVNTKENIKTDKKLPDRNNIKNQKPQFNDKLSGKHEQKLNRPNIDDRNMLKGQNGIHNFDRKQFDRRNNMMNARRPYSHGYMGNRPAPHRYTGHRPDRNHNMHRAPQRSAFAGSRAPHRAIR